MMKRSCGVVVWALVLCACGGDVDPADGANNASNNSNNNSNNNNSNNNNERPDMQVVRPDQPPAAPDWEGNWAVTIDYNVTCSSAFREDKSADVSGSWTVQISEVGGWRRRSGRTTIWRGRALRRC